MSDYSRDAIYAQIRKDEKDMRDLKDSLEEEEPELARAA